MKKFLFFLLTLLLITYPYAYADPLSVSTSKSVYKPGEIVKIYISGDPGVSYGVEVRDPANKLVFVDQVKADSNGKASTQFQLSSSAKTGTYKVYVTGGGDEATKTFKVQKPAPPPPPPAKKASSISLTANYTVLKYDQWIEVSGQLNPALENQKIVITYTSPSGAKEVHEVFTDASGNFRDDYHPLELGEWTVSASWAGNEEYRAARTSIVFYVKQLLTVYLNVEPSTIMLGSAVGLSGRVEPEYEGVPVILEYSFDSFEWNVLAEVTTGSDGSFAYTYTPLNVGRIFFRAFVNETARFFNATSNVVSVNVRVGVYAELYLTVEPAETQVGGKVKIQGKFNDTVTGHVEVYAMKGGEQILIGEIEIVEDDSFSLEWIPDKAGAYIIWAKFMPKMGSPSMAFTVLMVKPKVYTLGFKVINEINEPVQGVTVRVISKGVILAEALTDKNGMVSFTLPENEYNIKFIVNGVPLKEISVYLDSSKEETIVIPLVTIEIQVTDELGNALPNVPVFVVDVFGIKHAATTDEEGRAVLEVPRGEVKVVTEGLEEKFFADEGTKIGLELRSKVKYEYILAALLLGICIGLVLGKILFKPKIEKESEQS